MIVSMLVVFGACFGVLLNQYIQGTQRLEQVLAARDELITKVDALSHEMDYVQSDEYIMRAARDELGLIMPGEIRYVTSAG
jgi:cell division protein FtsB